VAGNADISITLLVPGLLGTLGTWRGFQMQREAQNALQPLEQWLAHARPVDRDMRGYEHTLLSLFDIPYGHEQDLPAAPLTLYADTGEPPPGNWLRADPVYLQADRDRVLMTSSGNELLDEAAAGSLVTELNEFLQPLGFKLSAPVPQRWYLRLPHAPGLRTSPVNAVIGHDVHDHMPVGDDARQWRALLNEVQMLLHGSEANRALQAHGMTVVNSLWFWGAGAMPPAGTVDWSHVWGEEPLLKGLALHHGIPMQSLPVDGGAWLSLERVPGRHLLVYDKLLHAAQKGDCDDWVRQVGEFAQYWCRPLQQALKSRRISQATLLPAHGTDYEITRRALRRWWRRRVGLAAFLDKHDNLYEPPS